jgi:hypothetical protein
MKRSILVLPALVMLLGLTVNSYALDFRGLRLGMTPNEVCKWLNPAVLEHCDPNHIGDIQDMAGMKLLGEGVTWGTVLISDSKVVKITVLIYNDESEAYRKAVNKKYGQPLTSRKVPYQNNFGVKMMGLEEHWKIRKEHIFFSVRPKTVADFETSLIFITDEWYRLETKKPEPRL